MDSKNPNCAEDSAYPPDPDGEYGWQKLLSERLYMSYVRSRGMEIHIARFHSNFGPEGSWKDGREKAPAAICRKVAETLGGGTMEMWGNREQTRSFLYIDECLEGVIGLMHSDFLAPVNIGSDEMVTINSLAEMAMDIAENRQRINHIDGPLGVMGRNSDNRLIQAELGWQPSKPLRDGIEKTYAWIKKQVEEAEQY